MTEWMLIVGEDPSPITTQSFIGIVVAIFGNVVISLALNCQKLAHRNIELARQAQLSPEAKSPSDPSTPPNGILRPHDAAALETEPLLIRGGGGRYEVLGRSSPNTPTRSSTLPPKLTQRLSYTDSPREIPWRLRFQEEPVVPISIANVSSQGQEPVEEEEEADLTQEEGKGRKKESEYLRSKLWCGPHSSP
jgi:magnesium transporter